MTALPVGAMSFEPLLADPIAELDVPTERELEIFRAEVGTRGLWSAHRVATKRARVFPTRPPVDRFGLTMEIVA